MLSALLKLRIPTIIFINKIDRSGAQADELIKRVKEKLTEHIIPLYRSENIGTKHTSVAENRLQDPTFLQACIEQLALFDEQLLAAYVEGETITEGQVRTALMQQVGKAKLYPVFLGSAITGAGVRELLADLINLFPSNTSLEEAPLSGVVFKLEKEATGEKVFWEGKTVQAQNVGAGEFCKVWGLKEVKIGDVVGEWSEHIKTLHFATPKYETRIEAKRREQDHQLYQVLLELAEQDPLVHVLKDDVHQTIYLRMFGEVQKEVIETMLKEHYGLDVRFAETGIVCIEKPRGTGQAIAIIGAADNPFLATVGFRVEPGPVVSGVRYKSTPGALPLAFYRAIEETVRATLAQGLYGWEVTDIVVTLTHTAMQPATTASDFRNLVPLVLMEALSQAGTDVYEPINQFELSVPASAISTAMFKLSALEGSLRATHPAQRHVPFDGHAACGNVRGIQERTSFFYGG